VIPVAVTLLVVWQRGWSLGQIVRHALASWLAVLSYVPLRLAFLGGSHLGGFISTPWEGLSKAGLALAWYVRHLLLPYPLSPFHPFPTKVTESWQIILGISTPLAILALFLFVLRRRETLFWLSWVFLPLVPALFHFFFVQQIASEIVVAERYAYISAAGFCSVLGLVIDGVSRKHPSQRTRRHRFWTTILALTFIGGVLLSNYGHSYATEKSIFEHALKTNPNNAFVLNGVGQRLLKEGKTVKALEYFSRAVEIQPNGAGFHINKGIALYRLETTLAAQQEFKTAIALNADIALAHTMLGDIYRDLGDVHRARESYERSAQLDPSNAVMFQNLGVARLLTGDREGAIDAWGRSLELDPASCDTHFNLGTALVDPNQQMSARTHLLQFLDCAGEDRGPQILTARQHLDTLQH
jgi:tetratricopeptide (TPR) repeat protein